jgi:hypothetical protein
MNWGQRAFGLVVVVLYLVVAAALIYFACSVAWTPEEKYKNVWVLAGVLLTAESAFVGIIVSMFTLNTQIHAARQLERQKEEILERVEQLKGQIARESEFVGKVLDVKSLAYEKLFVASNTCYRALQNLAKGQYDRVRIAECEKAWLEAEGLSANLDDADREIVVNIVQNVMDMIDEAEELRSEGEALKGARVEIWTKYAPQLGQAVKALRQRALFRAAQIVAPRSSPPSSGSRQGEDRARP